MVKSNSRLACLLLATSIPAVAFASEGDWPQWGGRNCRNLVSDQRGLPDAFVPGKKDPKTGTIDPATTESVKWVARMGTAAYGNPTVADGRVFVGTDDRLLMKSKRFKRARGGLVQCLDEQTGELLWRLVVPMRKKVPKGVWFVHQNLGVCSSPTVDGDRVYVISSAGDVLCLDVHGQANGNDGPYQDEATYMVPDGKPPIELTDRDADIIWRYDAMDEIGVRYHDAASCSVLIDGDMLYTGTSNGCDGPHKRILNPDAPSLIVLDKNTGRLLAMDNEKIGHRMPHCQWSPPTTGMVNGKKLIFFAGGDGIVYAFEAVEKAADEPVFLKKVWSYDGNPPEFKYRDGKPIPYYEGDKRKRFTWIENGEEQTGPRNTNDGTFLGPNQIIGTPVFHNNRIYVAMGQDPAHGRGRGLFHCIDATQTGDITESGCVWKHYDMERTLSTAAVADGLVYIPDLSGKLHCLDAETGEKYYAFDMSAETWGGPLVADGKVFLGTRNHFWILAAGREPKVVNQILLGTPAFSTPVAANGVLYVMSKNYLWAIEAPKGEPIAASSN